MMFMIPMPPTKSVMMPISPATTLSASVVWLNDWRILSCRLTVKLSS